MRGGLANDPGQQHLAPGPASSPPPLLPDEAISFENEHANDWLQSGDLQNFFHGRAVGDRSGFAMASTSFTVFLKVLRDRSARDKLYKVVQYSFKVVLETAKRNGLESTIFPYLVRIVKRLGQARSLFRFVFRLDHESYRVIFGVSGTKPFLEIRLRFVSIDTDTMYFQILIIFGRGRKFSTHRRAVFQQPRLNIDLGSCFKFRFTDGL